MYSGHMSSHCILLHNRSTHQYYQRRSYGAAVYRMAILSAKMSTMVSAKVSAMVSAILSAKVSAMASAKISMMVSAILSEMVSGRRRRCCRRYYILLHLLWCVSSNQ